MQIARVIQHVIEFLIPLLQVNAIALLNHLLVVTHIERILGVILVKICLFLDLFQY